MKHVKIIATVLIASMLLSMTVFAAGSDTLGDWGITVNVPDNTVAILNGSDGCYYIYPESSGSIPYVMLYVYDDYEDTDEAASGVEAMMSNSHDDMEVVSGPSETVIGGRECIELDMTYKVEGYEVMDRRVFIEKNDRIYMFVSKEIDELDMNVGSLLEDTIRDCRFEGEEIIEIEEDVVYITWEDYEDLAGEGSFVPFDVMGLELFIPGDMLELELTDDLIDRYFLAFYTTDTEEIPNAIAVQFVDTISFEDIEDYKQKIDALGEDTEILGEVNINGLDCLMYMVTSTESMIIGTLLDGGVAEFTFYPASDYDFMDVAEISASSIRRCGSGDQDIIISDDGDTIVYDDDDIIIEGGDDGDWDIDWDNLPDNLQDLIGQLQDALDQSQAN